MSLLINEAMAAAAGGPGAQANPMGSIVMMVGFILIIYFLMWRPQSKRAKEHRELVAGLSKGDEVITSGGILGKITKLADDFVVVSIGEGLDITVQRSHVSTSVPKGTYKGVVESQ